jgi:ATP-dependent DNA helicase DinG
MPAAKPHILGAGGAVACALSGYEVRPQQIEMADAVARAFAEGHTLLVEAGTGVGKSFAYLAPAIDHVAQRGGRVVISTHTIALQEQLIEKDIPFLQSVYPANFSAVLVKGRANYIGLRRLARASANQHHLFDSKSELADLHKIEDWAYETTDGSRSDLSFEPDLRVWERARSDADDCLGRKCVHFDRCFYQRARQRAIEAQLLIVNHALLFADVAVRQEGASILPDFEYLILDEAHTVETVAGDHLGLSVANTQVRFLLNSLSHERTGKGVAKNIPGQTLRAAVDQARSSSERYFGELERWFGGRPGFNGRLRERPPVEQMLSRDLLSLSEELSEAKKKVKGEDDKSELSGLADRAHSLATALAGWHSQQNKEWVYWIETAETRMHRVTLAARPLDVGPYLKQSLFDKLKGVVLTSATLVTDKTAPFAYIQNRLSLSDVKCQALGSPFNYREQLAVHVEAGLPDPAGPAFVPAACDAIKKYLAITHGHAFVLFTSYDMLRRCAEALAEHLEAENMPMLVQGAGMPRTRMLEKFRRTPRSVLLGTDTFWAGVDVPGNALTNVIIVKLPFASPTNPVIEARIEQIQQRGGNAFLEFQVPEAVLKFKQGVGRLIRTKTDKGIVVILDPRVRTKPYGRRFIEALPECKIIVNNAPAHART